MVFAALGAVSFAIWWEPFASTFALALHDERYTHILLILPISVALIVMDWKSAEGFTGVGVSIGGGLLVVAGMLAGIVRWNVVALPPDVQLSVNMAAFVVWWMGAFVLAFGTRAFRDALFPLCFLFWLVPFPEFVLEPIVSWLQRGSTASAHWLFAIARVPVEQRGMLLHIPGLTLEVAPECSSIRSSLVLVVTTMVSGAASIALAVAKGAGGRGGDSTLGGEERAAHIYDCNVGHARGSEFSDGETASPGRSDFSGDCAGGDRAADLDGAEG